MKAIANICPRRVVGLCFLADHTDVRAYAIQCCVRLSSVVGVVCHAVCKVVYCG